MAKGFTNTLTGEAYNFILKKIRTGELALGQDISEAAIANELDISRTPIREAIICLQKEGYLEVYPRKGTFVTRFSLEDILDIYNMRLMLEPHVITNNSNKISDCTKNDLIDFKNYNIKYINDDSILASEDEFFSNDEKFHLFLFNLTNNKYIKNTFIDALNKCMIAKRSIFISMEIKKNSIAKEHIDVIDAILEGNSDKIYASYKDHIRSHRDSIINGRF